MVKLKNVQAYPINNVPDHMTHECREVGKEICTFLTNNFGDKDPNIMLGAIAFVQSAMLIHFIVDDPEQIRLATKHAAVALVKNVECLTKLEILKDGQ